MPSAPAVQSLHRRACSNFSRNAPTFGASAGEIRGNLEKFTFIYGKMAVEALELEKITDFSFWDNGRSVIIYTGTQAVFDCNYDFFMG